MATQVVYARPVFGRRRWGMFWWKTFKWDGADRYKLCPVSTELALAMDWRSGQKDLVMGPYRLMVIRERKDREYLDCLLVSARPEEWVRRIWILITDLARSPFKQY